MGHNLLLTGPTGFLGNQILKCIGQPFHLIPISRKEFDFEISTKLNLRIIPDLLIHSAGLAHIVPKNEEDAQKFYEINFKGTERFLNAIQNTGKLPKSFVFISSVAVYGFDMGSNIDEDASLNAQDPYGKSKILAEKAVVDWCKENNVICTILRLPLLVGEKPKGNLESMIKAIQKGYYFNIGGGVARKSMVLAEDVAKFIPKVVTIGGIYNLTDGHHPSFKELSSVISKNIGSKSKVKNLPLLVAKFISKFGDLFSTIVPLNSSKYTKITSNLTFDDSKARKIGWAPKTVIEYYLNK
jgi:nucleoside-diphosphate-sugar epimerase